MLVPETFMYLHSKNTQVLAYKKTCFYNLFSMQLFFMYWPAAQTSPELIFHVINMSQEASVLLSVVLSPSADVMN